MHSDLRERYLRVSGCIWYENITKKSAVSSTFKKHLMEENDLVSEFAALATAPSSGLLWEWPPFSLGAPLGNSATAMLASSWHLSSTLYSHGNEARHYLGLAVLLWCHPPWIVHDPRTLHPAWSLAGSLLCAWVSLSVKRLMAYGICLTLTVVRIRRDNKKLERWKLFENCIHKWM